jgi:arylsulfatase A-like enzyme
MGARSDQPNVILIVLDTVRASNLSCYGHRRQTSPHLDELAAQAILYRRAVSPSPWTVPSHASLFTGLYPSQHGVHRRFHLLKPDVPVLPQTLQQQGYQTVSFSCNPWISHEFGFDRGFDQFFYGYQLVSGETDFFVLRRRARQIGILPAAKLAMQSVAQGNFLKNLVNGLYSFAARRYDKGAWMANQHVRRWLRRDYRPDRPFFMFINYLEPHLKYAPPRDYRKQFLSPNTTEKEVRSINQDGYAYVVRAVSMAERDFSLLEALYDAELRYLDDRFAELLELLEGQGVLENSLLIVTSDHGENIGDHGFMDHQYCLYDTLLHVPLIIRLPGTRNGSRIIHEMVEIKDIFATVLDCLGIESEIPHLALPGSSLLPDRLAERGPRFCMSEYLEPQPAIEELRLRYPGCECSQYDRRLRAVHSDDGYKFIWSSDGEHELYHLPEDPSEAVNLFGAYPEKAKELGRLLEVNLPPLKDEQDESTEELTMPRATRRRLEGLGYL